MNFVISSGSISERDRRGRRVCAAAREPDPRLSRAFESEPEKLLSIRQGVKKLKNNLTKAIKLEKYLDAAKFRDEIRELSLREPFLLYEQMETELAEAEKEEDYQKCIVLRDSMTELRARMPQFRLSGFWGGIFPGIGLQRIRIDIEGKTLTATQLQGDNRKLISVVLSTDNLLDETSGEKFQTLKDTLQKTSYHDFIMRFRGEAEILEVVGQLPPQFGPGGGQPPGSSQDPSSAKDLNPPSGGQQAPELRKKLIPAQLVILEERAIALLWEELNVLVIFEPSLEL
ncbi:hypothetical protein NDN08_005501 [Rhodosorus marinus]|uniref:UVR domain-containing protein n=1 Tax=Rhodosorus marinus TaxID=101924 RepID=A0AAV8V4K8_9RHOD|nr:hypothetical protein NDN08_005501 [Rhodosorus marinus]